MSDFKPKTSSYKHCHGCHLPVTQPRLKNGQSAVCPQCRSLLYRGGHASLDGNLAIAITCLMLFLPSCYYHFIHIHLLGMDIKATLLTGIWGMFKADFDFLAIVVLFCSLIAPLIVCGAVITAHYAFYKRSFRLLKNAMSMLKHLKHWMMIDVYLVSVAIACFKLRDYADIFIGPALYCLILLQILTILLIIRTRPSQYWQAWKNERSYQFDQFDYHCTDCDLSQPPGSHCARCHAPQHTIKPHVFSHTWAYLLTALFALVPANYLAISVFTTNGQRAEDTIFSGVATLVGNGFYGIAAIIFIASIAVPVAKIVGLLFILIVTHCWPHRWQKERMAIYFVVKWIGKWSVMDLFVISIMMTLIDRGQILNFMPGMGAVAFAFVVIFTMLAAESFDPRVIWSTPQTNTQYGK